MLGNIHSFESFGSLDGPGIRFVIFLQGCAMRCRYCHNVDTWNTKTNQLMSADEVLDKAERYRSYWGKDGGITVSGGEPLLQIDFLLELFQKAKKRGISTCLDTALQPFQRTEPFFSTFNDLLKVTDLLLVDIKVIDPKRHKELTGWDNKNILDAITYLSDVGKPVWIRHVLVPEWTDDDAYLRKTRAFLLTLKNVEKIEVLPFHKLGEYKWADLGIPYLLKAINPPSSERIRNAEDILNGRK